MREVFIKYKKKIKNYIHKDTTRNNFSETILFLKAISLGRMEKPSPSKLHYKMLR